MDLEASIAAFYSRSSLKFAPDGHPRAHSLEELLKIDTLSIAEVTDEEGEHLSVDAWARLDIGSLCSVVLLHLGDEDLILLEVEKAILVGICFREGCCAFSSFSGSKLLIRCIPCQKCIGCSLGLRCSLGHPPVEALLDEDLELGRLLLIHLQCHLSCGVSEKFF